MEKLTKENIYIDLRGKSKEELTELYLLLKNNNEEILNDGLDLFIRCYLNLESKDDKFHFYSEVWSCAASSAAISKQEVTIEQLKEIIKPMGTFTPIAMKCTQEQFEAVRPKLIGLDIIGLDSFSDYNYLVNNIWGELKLISNIPDDYKGSHNRKVYEEWNEEIFLKACGIEVDTLQQQLQKAEAEVKRLRSLIEDNKPKNGDICVMDNGNFKFITIFNDHESLMDMLKIKKIQDLELINKLNELIK